MGGEARWWVPKQMVGGLKHIGRHGGGGGVGVSGDG